MDLTLRTAELEAERTLEREGVRKQLARILVADSFKNSRRYGSFLKHVVERTLEGRSGEIKERNLGVEVFARSPDYDTASDPVVRITAGEVRKRLAQYYDNPSHAGELRIELPCGGYVPEFRDAKIQTAVVAPESAPLELPAQEPAGMIDPARRSHALRSWAAWLLAPTVVASFALGIYAAKFSSKTQLDMFWAPVVAAASSPVIVSVGEHGALYDASREIKRDTYQTTVGTNDNLLSPSTVNDLIGHNVVSWADAVTVARLTGLLQAQGKSFSIRRSGLTPLSDLRDAPSILVGGFNNKWIMHLLSGLRFSYRHSLQDSLYWIQDNQNPSSRNWSVDLETAPVQFKRDFGIVARFWDVTTEKPIVVASGIASYGTLAAGEFLSTSQYMDLVAKQAAPGWKTKNIEIVFSTAIIDGNIGPPEILKTYVW